MVIRSAPGDAIVAPHLRRRVRAALVILAVAFAILIGRLWQLQIVRGEEYYQNTLNNVVHERVIPSVRGRILDRDGVTLAGNRPAFNIYADADRFEAHEVSELARLLDLDAEERELVHDRLDVARERGARRPVLVLEDQGRDRAALVAQARLELPGVEVRDEPYRHYPHGDLAAHLLGYMNQLTPDEVSELAADGYRASEMIGRYALERQWENYLRGKKGIERQVVNARGERVDDAESEALIDGPRFVPPVAGHDVVLTIDHDLQTVAETSASKEASAAIAVIEVKTGRLLALVSKPSFDPNVMTGHLTRADEKRLMSDPRKPFIDKTLRAHYPPGSTFKPITAVAALDDRELRREEELFCPGSHRLGRRTFHCLSSHGKMNVVEAIQHSCNVFFWKVSERVGLDPLADVALDFGFGAPTGLGLNGDVPGRIPTKDWYEETRGFFTVGYTLNAAVGQGDVAVTVIQLAMAYSALANGGELHVPQVVQRVDAAGGETIAAFEPRLRRRVDVSQEALAIVREGMTQVVNESGGTAYRRGRSELVAFAGKTGTAQVRNSREQPDESLGWHPARDHAWFAGFAPAKDPEIALAVLIPHGGHGGGTAAPVAKDIVEAYFTDVSPRQGSAAGREGAR